MSHRQNSSGTQTIDFDTVNFTVLDQITAVKTSLSSTTKVTSNHETFVTKDEFSFPINVDFTFPVRHSRFGFTGATAQNYRTSQLQLQNGSPIHMASVTNSAKATDVRPLSSSQRYRAIDSDVSFYVCRIASADDVLSAVSFGWGGGK